MPKHCGLHRQLHQVLPSHHPPEAGLGIDGHQQVFCRSIYLVNPGAHAPRNIAPQVLFREDQGSFSDLRWLELALLFCISARASPSFSDGLAVDQVYSDRDQARSDQCDQAEQIHHSTSLAGSTSYWTIRTGPLSVSLITSSTVLGRASSHSVTISDRMSS